MTRYKPIHKSHLTDIQLSLGISASPSSVPKALLQRGCENCGARHPSSAKSLCSASFRLGSLFFSILRRCIRVERK